MYHKLSDFIEDWKYESESTIKVFNNLSDESLTVKFNKEIRTPGRLAWHIVTSVGEMAHRTGLTFETVDENAPIPKTVKEIVDEYKRSSGNLGKKLKKSGVMRLFYRRMICMVRSGREEKLWEH